MSSAPADRPWLASYAPGVPADVIVPRETLTAPLWRAEAAWGSHPALEFFGASTTYTELAERVRRTARVLADAGVGHGDRVALVLPNCPAHVAACYAAWSLGAIVVEINPTYTAAGMASQLRDCGATVAIAWQAVAALVIEASTGTALTRVFASDMVADMPLLKRAALTLPIPMARRLRAQLTARRPSAASSLERLVADAAPLAETPGAVAPEDVAMLLYTGGTTGVPKAAMLTHGSLTANAVMGEAWLPMLQPGCETSYAILPFFHAFGVMLSLVFPLRIAAKVVLLPKFDPALVLAAWKHSPATFVGGVPPIFDRLAQAAVERGADLTSVRVSLSGAMSLPGATARRWEETTGSLMIEGYGMTETSPIALGNPVSEDRRPGALGLPFPSTQIRIVDPEDPTRDVAPGDTGELLLKGPQVFAGYWQAPTETALSFCDGWLRTGDIVRMDESGFVTLVDRIKEVIITGGFNVYPSQVEAELERMPEVKEAAVIGVPAGERGERVVAAIVLAAGAHLDLDKIRAWCGTTLARYAIPRELVILTELPRSQIGKVLRRVVREQILQGNRVTT